MKYGLFGKFIAHDGKRDELAVILIEAAKLLETTNEDCLQYTVGISQNSNDVWVSEVWTNKEAHDTSLEPVNVRNLIMKAAPLIKAMPSGTEYDVLGGKGMPVTE